MPTVMQHTMTQPSRNCATAATPDHYANTDWLDEVLRNAPMWQHRIGVSGGSGTSNYMASLSYSNQDGIMMQTGVERLGFRLNLDTKYKRFSFGMNAFGSRSKITAPCIRMAIIGPHIVLWS